jgi:hypothetical protein
MRIIFSAIAFPSPFYAMGVLRPLDASMLVWFRFTISMIIFALLLSSIDVDKKQHIRFLAVYLRVLVMTKVTFLAFGNSQPWELLCNKFVKSSYFIVDISAICITMPDWISSFLMRRPLTN